MGDLHISNISPELPSSGGVVYQGGAVGYRAVPTFIKGKSSYIQTRKIVCNVTIFPFISKHIKGTVARDLWLPIFGNNSTWDQNFEAITIFFVSVKKYLN